METFQEYNRELSNTMAQLVEAIDEEKRSSLYTECETLLEQMKSHVRLMDDKDTRTELMERLKVYKQNLQGIKAKRDREALFQAGGSPANYDKNRLKQAEEMMERQNETLEFARRTIEETESVGLEIQQELGRNRESIQSSQKRVDDIRSNTAQSSAILKNMSKWWNR